MPIICIFIHILEALSHLEEFEFIHPMILSQIIMICFKIYGILPQCLTGSVDSAVTVNFFAHCPHIISDHTNDSDQWKLLILL